MKISQPTPKNPGGIFNQPTPVCQDITETGTSYYFEGQKIAAPLVVINSVSTNTDDSFYIHNSINATLPVVMVFRADGKVIKTELNITPEGKPIKWEHPYYTPGIEPNSIYFLYLSSGSFEVKYEIITKRNESCS